MGISADHCGAVILAGGRSRRMGCCKATLKINGKTMLERLSESLRSFDEQILSANDPSLAEGLPVRLVPDRYPDSGPLGGLHAALSATEKDALLCVSCDLPNFTAELAALLLEHFPPDTDAMVCRDGTGQVHPLCGVYKKSVLPVLEAHLQAGNRRMVSFLEDICCVYLHTAGLVPDSCFFNMNTPETYRFLLSNTDGGFW